MSVESVTYINDLEPDRPRASDRISQGDDHIRNLKKAIKQTFPNIDGEVSASDEEINYLVGLTEPIKDSIDAGSQDLTALEAEVAKKADKSYVDAQDAAIDAKISQLASDTSSDIGSLQGQIDNKADKSYVDSQNSAQDAVTATKADKSYVDSENSAQNSAIALKADKSYVDSQNAAQNTNISAKADKTYVDSQDAKKADKTYVDSQDAKKADKTYVDSQDAKKADKTYVDSQDALKADKSNTYTKAEIDVLIEEASKRGGMIKLVTQPSAAGNFTVSSHPQAYMCQFAPSGSSFDKSATLSVPQGMVFCFEYLWGFGGSSGDVFIDPEGIYVDGVPVYNVSGGMPPLQYNSTGGPIWPGNDKSAIIRVEQSVEIRRIQATGAGCTVWVAGFFAEA